MFHCFSVAKYGLSRLSFYRQAHLPAHLCMAGLQDRAVAYFRRHSIETHPETEVRHASTNSRDENAQSNHPDVRDQSIRDIAVKHSTATFCRFSSATRLQFPSSRSTSGNDIPPRRQQASQAERPSQATSQDISSLQLVSPTESPFPREQHPRQPFSCAKPQPSSSGPAHPYRTIWLQRSSWSRRCGRRYRRRHSSGDH